MTTLLRCLFCIGAGISLSISGCSHVNTAGGPGTGSETTNGIMATVVYQNGQPAVHVPVYLCVDSFLVDTSKIDSLRKPDAVTDSMGRFFIDSVMPGSYNIEITDGKTSSVLIPLRKDSATAKPLDMGKQTLLPVATVSGHIDRSNLPVQTVIYVQIYGLNKITRVDEKGDFSFGTMPEGVYDIRISSNNQSLGTVEHDSISVGAGYQHDLGIFQMPVNFWQDTIVIRAILDSNGLDFVTIKQVTASKNGRIFLLDLSHRGITKIPSQIGLLRITHLYLDSNSLSALPPEIGSVASLVSLRAANNQLTRLPTTIGNLKRLTHLDVSGNDIDSLPWEIGQLESLSDLWLKNNKIVAVPESVGNLLMLRMLDLENNRLVSLPFTIIKLRNLIYLSVLHNRLNSVVPSIAEWLDKFSTEKEWRSSQSE